MSVEHRFESVAALTEAAARHIVALARASIAARGRFTLALSGGSTPKPLFRLLATEYAHSINWAAVHVFWSDERCVPPTSADSNYKLAHDLLLAHVALPPEQIHRLSGEDDPTQAAEDYGQVLRMIFGGPPRFDLILLGMGDDGHTASLFPGTSALTVADRWVVANYVEKASMWRLTFTYPTLYAAREIMVLIAGADKQPIYDHVRTDAQPPYPIQQVRVDDGELGWWVAF